MNLWKLNFKILLFFSLIIFNLSLFFLYKDKVVFLEWEIFYLNSVSVIFLILMDWMSLLFMSFVLFISSMVMLYSEDYMMGDKNYVRFIYLVLLFIFSMMMMIMSPNLISILLGWDGLGLVSYCLVIYYQNIKSYNAGMLTVLSNRIGDVCLLLGIAWMLNYGGWNFFFYMDYFMNMSESKFIIVLVVLAGMTKSAQIPFSAWLPAAMAAPTPVSALVHSSTLVTAGVYLLIRFFDLLMNFMVVKILLLLSCLTMFMSGIGANFEFDLKKIIALSTLSQLGLMIMVLSMGYKKLAFFHLLTHAMFKALLFLCAGMIIHCFMNFQDIRYMGKLINYLPLTILSMNISMMSLCGLPFLAGFYSKDLILELSSMSEINFLMYFLYYFSSGLTVSYSVRLVYYTMIKNLGYISLYNFNEESLNMLKGKIGLVFLAIMSGSMLNWLMFFNFYIIILPKSMKMLILFIILMGMMLGYECSKFMFNFNKFSKNFLFYYFLGLMWFMPMIFSYSLNKMVMMNSMIMYKSLDQGWSEKLGGQGLYMYMVKKSSLFQILQKNDLKMFLLLSLFLILFIYLN
uniref:NADH-ubiquinone oxidoreductase chain 5 n=1 Tax=Mongoloraphidia harmandi TaxID=633873 RepID=C8YXC4_9NEOP|nr:NADH dehydrogenase subunit 5 [Mongoloraphidia harmandi]ACO92558.1 NADH dehydrogenase subunit 5 [Mongoloraphidia harmandi]